MLGLLSSIQHRLLRYFSNLFLQTCFLLLSTLYFTLPTSSRLQALGVDIQLREINQHAFKIRGFLLNQQVLDVQQIQKQGTVLQIKVTRSKYAQSQVEQQAPNFAFLQSFLKTFFFLSTCTKLRPARLPSLGLLRQMLRQASPLSVLTRRLKGRRGLPQSSVSKKLVKNIGRLYTFQYLAVASLSKLETIVLFRAKQHLFYVTAAIQKITLAFLYTQRNLLISIL